MSQTASKPPVIAIVGPTASGKTTLSIALAKTFSGEIISADSRQVYRGLDIGTAKITSAEMENIPHHLLDICDPKNTYTAANFANDARLVLNDITKRDKLPIIAGGTFFYLDLLMNKVSAPKVPPNPILRAKLEQLSKESLLKKLTALDPVRASHIDTNNSRRLVRAIEITIALGSVPPLQITESPYRWLTIGIDISLSLLEKRIKIRIDTRLAKSMIEEVEQLHTAGLSYERLDALGLEYRYISRYLQGLINKEKMVTEIITKTRQFAKRQKTWLKRNHDIVWLPFPVNTTQANTIVQNFLNKN